MTRTVAVVATLCLLTCSGWAATWTVTSKASSGLGTLNWAIVQANGNAGGDLITFAAKLTTKTIQPTTQLPALSDGGTTIDGDLDDDGAPDILIDGRSLSSGTGSGLRITHSEKPGCSIRGLAIINCPDEAIRIDGSMTNSVKGCYLGVNRAGTGARRNGKRDIYVVDSYLNTIGGTAATDRNLFASGAQAWGGAVRTSNSRYTRVWGNHFGLAADGSPLSGCHLAVSIRDGSSKSSIGGDDPGEGNVLANLAYGMVISTSSFDNVVAGNLFGLAPDGSTAMPISEDCVQILTGASYNTIGGITPEARNTFVSSTGAAVLLNGSDTSQNKIRGNYFGTNAAGTGKRPLADGVYVSGDTGPQTIGGPRAEQGNYFCCDRGVSPMGVGFVNGGEGSLVQNNRFGIRPNGRDASGMENGVYVQGVGVDILDNTFAGMTEAGVQGSQTGRSLRILGNSFQGCDRAVYMANSSYCFLGSLGNVATDDDGGNTFADSNTWFIYNLTNRRIRAEGNTFPSTSRAAINAKIYDNKDNPVYGPVDFDPLAGGVSPTGGGIVGVSGLSALSTAGGAEIVFTLSSPADVTVTIVNLAARPVATIAAASPMGGGVQRLSWNGRGNTGLAAPAGPYLVSITAQSDSGDQARALAPLRLNR